jgi:uncharacterized membrane protein YsdA (DUF1294 family)
MNYIYIWNIIVALIYGIDKLLAKGKKRRMSERFLLFTAFLLGAAGAMFGMVIFNHKTSKMKFRLLVPFYIALNIILIKAYYMYL